jgi:hypothetical protein
LLFLLFIPSSLFPSQERRKKKTSSTSSFLPCLLVWAKSHGCFIKLYSKVNSIEDICGYC